MLIGGNFRLYVWGGFDLYERFVQVVEASLLGFCDLLGSAFIAMVIVTTGGCTFFSVY